MKIKTENEINLVVWNSSKGKLQNLRKRLAKIVFQKDVFCL